MTKEEYYGEYYPLLLNTQKELESIAFEYMNEEKFSHDLQKVVYYCSRIKSPESMQNKLILRGFSPTVECAMNDVFDAVGLRIICSFESDVQDIVDLPNEIPPTFLLQLRKHKF